MPPDDPDAEVIDAEWEVRREAQAPSRGPGTLHIPRSALLTPSDAAAAQVLARANARNVVADWDDAHRYTPAPRHRRRLILKWVSGLDFADVLDAGCAQPYLL